MSRVRHKDTSPEMAVRRLVHRLGYRYRLHGKGLPGRPDLVFRSRKAVIFVHGCFWHLHRGCARVRVPKSNRDFWGTKLGANAARDVRTREALEGAGWRVLVVWECEIGNQDELTARVRRFLDAG